MAAYYKVDVSLSTNSVTVGSPSAQEVLVTLPLVGPQGATGPQGPAGAGAVESVNGQTGVVVLNASDVAAIATSVLTTQGDIVVRGASAPQRLALGNGVGKPLVVGASGPEWSVADSNFVLSQSVKISNAGTTAVNGVYLPTNSINGKASYIKEDYTISWDGASWNISANTTDYYTSSNDTSYPWQATTWTVDSGASPYPDVEQAAFSDMESVLGSKSYNTRTPSSTLAHASSHHTGGTDAIAPNNISAAWAQTTTSATLTDGSTTEISASRNVRYEFVYSGSSVTTIRLSSTGNSASDEIVVTWVAGGTTGNLPVQRFDGFSWSTIATITSRPSSLRFRFTTAWALVAVDTHTQAASTITGLGTAATANLDALPETLRIVGGTDATKKLAFEVDTLVDTATTRTLTVPNSSGTIALLETLPAGGTKTYATFTATDNQPPATAFATLDTRNSIAVLDYDDATDESAVFVSIIPEAASLGSGLKIRLHWMATTATSGNVVWDVSLERMTTDLDADSFATIASGTAAANGTSGILTVTEITLTTIDSVTAGDGFRLKVTRDANNGSDTMTGDAELVVCEIRSAA